jgi:signal peptidase I
MKDIINEDLEQTFDELLRDAIVQKKEVTLENTGHSMEPLLKPGDLVSFKKVNINKVKWLDLVVFSDNNNYISHRVIKIIRKNGRVYIISKSDISGKYDKPIQEENFIGIITKIKKPDKTIFFDTLEGRLRNYMNILISPLYLFKQRKEYFKNENDFLMLISRTYLDRSSIIKVENLLFKNLNWDHVFERIRGNFIAPFALKNIIKNSELQHQIPLIVQEKIKEIVHRQLYNDTKVCLELKSLLSAFNRNNIKVMVIKGAHLGEEVYGNTFLRWMGDVDILARTNDWSKIKEILQNIGFECRGKDDYDYWGLDYLDNHITFFKNGVRLELKFNIWQMDFPFFEKDIWQRARSVILREEEVLVPSIEDTLLLACASLTRHSYAKLIWFCDIREIIDRFRGAIDWDIVIRRAKEKDIDCIVYYSLYYSSKLLKYEIPQIILQRLKPSFIKEKLHNFLWDEKVILWRKEGHPLRADIPFEFAILLFGGKISFKPKKLLKMLLYISSVIIPPRVHLSRRYRIDENSPRLIFCYLLQPFRFILMISNSLMLVMSGRKKNKGRFDGR